MKIISPIIMLLIFTGLINTQEMAYNDISPKEHHSKIELANHSVSIDGCPLESGSYMS